MDLLIFGVSLFERWGGHHPSEASLTHPAEVENHHPPTPPRQVEG